MSDDTVNVSYPREGIALVEFCGEHDLATKEETGALLERLVAENGRVVVDLCSATFIDSSFLSCLLAARKSAAEHDHELRILVQDSPNIAAVFRVSGVSEHLAVVATLDEARLTGLISLS